MKNALLVTLAACAGLARPASYYSVNADGSKSVTYARINEWSSYGQHGLGAQPVIARAFEDAEHAPAPVQTIDIFNSTMPPGVTIEAGIMKVEPGTKLEPVGKFELGYWVTDAPHEQDIEPDLHRLAQVVNGDVLVVTIGHVAHGDDRVQYVTGYVLRKPSPMTADVPKPHAHLVYSATASCPSEQVFGELVTKRLGYSPWQAIGPEVKTEILQSPAGFVAKVSFAGTHDEMSATSCGEASDAAALAIASKLAPLQP
ncbi:MAG: hypothetical protein QM831_08065 [Kofleriaceae bacterium]